MGIKEQIANILQEEEAKSCKVRSMLAKRIMGAMDDLADARDAYRKLSAVKVKTKV